MAGGLDITPAIGVQLAAVGTIIAVGSGTSGLASIYEGILPTPYRPSVWNKAALTSITIPGTTSSANNPQAGDNGAQTLRLSRTEPTMLVFDAVLRVNHQLRMTASRHPVQTGANITDNIRREPITLTLEVKMSDAIGVYKAGMWVGSSSKSISAFLTMQKVARARQLVTVKTRLQTYENLALLNVHVPDGWETLHGLKMTLEFEEIILVNVATVSQSARPGATDSTALGTKQADAVPAAAVNTNMLPSPLYPGVEPGTLEEAEGTTVGAGVWSSNPTSQLPGGAQN